MSKVCLTVAEYDGPLMKCDELTDDVEITSHDESGGPNQLVVNTFSQ